MDPVLHIKKSYADTPYGQVHYRYILPVSSEPQKTPIVMLHKSASSSASYEAIMHHLAAQGYNCYALDMPGFGASFDPPEEAIAEILKRGTRWYVEVFVSALTSIGLLGKPAKVHLMGHHSGASLAPELAATHPDAVETVTLIGTAVMSENERAEMKKKYFEPFNKPVPDGSHLLKTWDYLRSMGVGDDIDMFQREAVDHIRAWKGRNQIYGAVWEQDLGGYLDMVKCPIMFVCARDDVLWEYQEKAKERWTHAVYIECRGANFSPDLDSDTICKAWLAFTQA
ncbi:Alpha/Beta hydrolase protein [Stachybotrys elegans]|uniref:Alpha/Beta hydrolase protein n=1 Tax=Stachybotrys elegans TaxID=80388 RepID=A0A8K0SE57_9HYPO|nr:Alpha/Beta hydrolase protein [Stachybotrys elegans]